MIDDFAKGTLHGRLRRDREALLWKLDGLSEYDARRPLTATGTNLLGLVKHVATVEARYFGEVFARPYPEPLPRWQDSDGSDLWAAGDETREQITAFYRRTWEHSDATIDALSLDAPGHVPWWPEPHADTNLFAVMVHVLGESIRHAGHADILREGLDGRTGLRAEHETPIDEEARAAHRAEIERAARSVVPAASRQERVGAPVTGRRTPAGTVHGGTTGRRPGA
ncbi:DinB family protein [Streptomyces globosus]|uniref:DinB family protein n=1 Tax=Streptomyces globosus TaxID=68209 RepID=UPI0038141DD4